MHTAKQIELLTTDVSKARPFKDSAAACKYAENTLGRERDGISYEGGRITPFWEFNGIAHFLLAA